MDVLTICLVAVAVALLVVLVRVFSSRKPAGVNPFAKDHRRAAAAHVADLKARDAVLKQGFTASKVQEGGAYDTIVIGSGIGGLTTAALLARAGQKVLVLEQHDQAGGCCHTFYEKGYEFDTGIHYIGEMRNNTLMRFLLQQLTSGQLQWTDMDDVYDTVLLGEPDALDRIPIASGKEEFTNTLLEFFPNERKAITKYLDLLSEYRRSVPGGMTSKLLSPTALWFLKAFGLVDKFTPYFKISTRTLQDVLDELTTDEKLKAVLAYSYGDYGTPPSEASFGMHATLVSHMLYGTAYPQGGPSEIAFHMIPTIEESGGRVLVRAKVNEILLSESGAVSGVRVLKGATGTSTVDVPCKTVVSTAGVFNTFERLLPEEARVKHPSFDRLLGKVKHGVSCFSLFIGLNKPTSELQLPAASYWALPSINLDKDYKAYMAMDAFEASQSTPPVLFISFPCAKDITWDERFPGKSNALVIIPASYEWFAQWEDERVMKRSADYEQLKAAFQETIWKRTCALMPQLEEAADYVDLASPVTNRFYLNAPEGELYGADHDVGRFEIDTFSKLRPDTEIPGLYLSGQDVLTCGFGGAMFGGVISAGVMLNRNIMQDMIELRKAVPPSQSSFPRPSHKDAAAKKDE